MNKYELFLGGTCAKNNWRIPFTEDLIERGVDPATIFYPVVPDWNDEARVREEEVKATARYKLYYIGNTFNPSLPTPNVSMHEVAMGLFFDPSRTIAVFDIESWEDHPNFNHIQKTYMKILKDYAKAFPYALIFESLEEIAEFLAQRLTQ